jgi:hypothetical protein
MKPIAIDFDALPWESPRPGVRFKAWREGGRQLRLLEFSLDFVEADWCEKGHSGYVLRGSLEVEFKHHTAIYREGSGIHIPAGPACGHKARALTPKALLFLVEDD